MKLISPFKIWPSKGHSSYGHLSPVIQGSIMSNTYMPIRRGAKRIRIEKMPKVFSVQIPLTAYTRYSQPRIGMSTGSQSDVRLFKKID